MNQRVVQYALTAGLTFVGSCGLALYQIRRLSDSVNSVVNPRAACMTKNAQYIYVDCLLANVTEPNECDSKPQLESKVWEDPQTPWSWWWDRRRLGFSWRLLEMISEAESPQERNRTIKKLVGLRTLTDSDYRHLAQLCNAESAVALAREDKVDNRFFLSPPIRKESVDKQKLVDGMYRLLCTLKAKHPHKCLNYFISRAFPSFKRFLIDLDLMSEGPRPLQISQENILPLCIESLLHHCLTRNYVKDVVDVGALELLMDVHRYTKNNFEAKLLLVNIIIRVASYPEHLPHLFDTGWIGVLVRWSQDCDQRIASPAASALANLDCQCELGSGYGNEVCLLQPLCRTEDKHTVDVVMVHGLLGGAHTTWHQRQMKHSATFLPFSGILSNQKDNCLESYCAFTGSVMNDVPEDILKQTEEEDTISDWVVVMDDIPVSCSKDETIDEYEYFLSEEELSSYCQDRVGCKSQCWPKDWLPQDCSHLRIIGVNYDSRITDWFSWCPLKDNNRKQKLAGKAKELMEQLIACGVGDRPVVWIAHSMGGLIVKHMIVQAGLATYSKQSIDHQNFIGNSKSVVFLSTPHFGSPIASLNKLLLLPSGEVEELSLNDPQLTALHRKFSNCVKRYNMDVVSFVETKNTKVTSWELELRCVPPILGDRGTGTVYEIPLSHLDIAKPGSRLSFIYQKILKAVQNAQK